jgi:CxxC motif-containing protein (DUF1111 family)
LFKYLSTLLTLIALISLPTTAIGQLPELTTDFTKAEAFESLPGGDASSDGRGKNAFLEPAGNLAFKDRLDFKIGESIFAKLWVFSPSSTQASDGLGPLHNARSCIGCHLRGGRGHVPDGNWPVDNAISMLMRLSIDPQSEQQKRLLASGKTAFIPEPNYGAQLQDFAMQGLNAEGRIQISYTPVHVKLNPNRTVVLRKPIYSVTDLKYGPLHKDLKTSVRVASPMIGLGLLEAISKQDLLKLEDIEDANQDGISGKANRVWDVQSQSIQLGRFGWKAGSPSLSQQNSSAFATDMGLSTQLFEDAYQGDCTDSQLACLKAPDGRSKHLQNVEVAPQMSKMLTLFTRNIGVPKRLKSNDEEVLAGKALFYQSGCTGCHQPKFITGVSVNKEQSNQLIWPYSDLLLHDMGEGLADDRPEFKANGREWRTAPLWGIGHTAKVSGKKEFLHDGRARSLLEAVLWHGGEASDSKYKVINMSEVQRSSLITFLESL